MSVIKFYPFSEDTVEFAPPPKPASKFVPEWYKDQKTIAVEDDLALRQGFAASTVKRCMPVFDIMTAGYMLLAPCDIFVDATNPEKLEFNVPQAMMQWKNELFSYHSPEQYDSYPFDSSQYHKQLLRIMPTWSVGTEKGYSTIFMNPHHRDDSPLYGITAIVDTDGFITDGHVSFWVKKTFKGIIKQGTPLLQVIPFKREEWKSELVDAATSSKVLKRQRLDLRSTFSGAYKNKFRSKKEFK